MKEELLDMLCCPTCKNGGLHISSAWEKGEEFEGEIREGLLSCALCASTFPIRHGMVDLLPDPTPEVKREIEAWESTLSPQQFTEEEHARSRAWVRSLPFPNDPSEPLESRETWRRHGKAIFGLCDAVDWKGKRVLELGAGRCWLSAHLARKGAQVVAIDVLEKEYMGLRCADFYLEEGTYFERVICDMHRLPFKGRTFDAVVTTATLHHSSTVTQLLREVSRVTRRGGLMVAANEPLKLPCRELPAEEELGANESVYSLGQWQSFFTGAGWEINHLKVRRDGAVQVVALATGNPRKAPLAQRVRAWCRYLSLFPPSYPRYFLGRILEIMAIVRPPIKGDFRSYLSTWWRPGWRSVEEPDENNVVWGPGWYSTEGTDYLFRWSGVRSCLLLPPSEGLTLLTIELASLKPNVQTHPVVVKLKVGKEKPVRIRIAHPTWKAYHLKPFISSEEKSRTLTIKVIKGSFRPCSSGINEDKRMLGVACRSIRLEKACGS